MGMLGSGQSEKKDHLIGQCPVVDVVIQGVKTPCLIDTGSQVTTLTKLFQEIFGDCGANNVSTYSKV